MLQRVQIQNFRSLRSLDVPLRPLTVLIGPNDSGKSAFLAAIQQFVNGIAFHPWDHWRHDTSQPIVISGTFPQGVSEFTSARGFINPELAKEFRPSGFLHLPAQGVVMDAQGQSDDQGPPALTGGGEGLPALLDYFLRRERERFFAVVNRMRELVPGLDDVLVATPHPAIRRLDFVVEKGFQLEGQRVSGGVRLLLVYVALAYHPLRPKIILLEEPETGFHPKRLGTVMEVLRGMTEGKYGGLASQVVLTTHSPYLLDRVDIEKDQVLVFSRKADGSRTAEPADAERLKVFMDEFMLGEVWFNEGEGGLVAHQT